MTATDCTVQLVLMGVLHRLLAGMLARDLAERRKVLGGRKWPRAVATMLMTFVGSMVYMLCHPQIFFRDEG